MNEKEIWKPIKGYEDQYEISDLGRVKSVSRLALSSKSKNYRRSVGERIVGANNIVKGYKKVDLFKNNKRRQFYVHRLVASAFLLNVENKPNVNHIDGNKLNNCAENLEWVTQKENINHAITTGLTTCLKGENSITSKLKWDEVRTIRKLNEEGIPSINLAKKYNVHYNTIRNIINFNTWQEVESDG